MASMLAFVFYPSAQKRAQAELDRVVGRGRLPTFEDQPLLPYVSAVCRELLRWHVIVPLSIAHSPTKDDIYDRMFIPKGTPMLMNAWAILHGPEVYPASDPEGFKPERFLTTEGALNDDDVQGAFGLRRRSCVRLHFANSMLWIMVASVLATFDVTKTKDGRGNEIPVDVNDSDGFVSHPLRSIVPFAQEVVKRKS
ncbi:cytochrome P450 [Artomyces pyxidatus]|uniref:Cytochrome P450 n=1 Tax=Artomyces pyxidatus TaxID=48021 RepID=A0ACB8T603_9AGAM|nr:cytochrome P450 [Artomyces pyxidatus]